MGKFFSLFKFYVLFYFVLLCLRDEVTILDPPKSRPVMI